MPGVEKRCLELVADLVLAVQHGDLAEAVGVLGAVADDVVDDPGELAVIRVEVQRARPRTAMSGRPAAPRDSSKIGGLMLDEPAREARRSGAGSADSRAR